LISRPFTIRKALYNLSPTILYSYFVFDLVSHYLASVSLNLVVL
jgi:hypothetical protein